MEKEAGTNSPRILVLGSVNHPRLVTAHLWHELPLDLNVSDFDVIIMNFQPLANAAYAQSVRSETLPKWSEFGRHILSRGSEVLVIGTPNFRIGTAGQPPIWWLPLDVEFIYQSGEDIREIHDAFAFYFTLVRRYSFYLERVSANTTEFQNTMMKLGGEPASIVTLEKNSLAETRFHRSVGFALKFDIFNGRHLLRTSGVVMWLPEPTEISTAEGINLILRERYGLATEASAPHWIDSFLLPEEKSILAEIAQKDLAKTNLEKEIRDAGLRLSNASRLSKILYEKGEDVLEPVVRDVLRVLGANVADPAQRGREDGRLIDASGRAAMLEIKGRSGNLRLSDVRELDNWVRDAIAHEGWIGKGLLIVNLQCEEDPRNRKDFVPPNCARAAELFDLAIVTTTQLFAALVLHQKHKLDQQAFWDSVFTAKGLCDLPSESE